MIQEGQSFDPEDDPERTTKLLPTSGTKDYVIQFP